MTGLTINDLKYPTDAEINCYTRNPKFRPMVQKQLCDEVDERIRQMNEERQKIVERAFDQKDSDRSGSLSITEIQNISHYQSSAVTLLAVRKSSPEAFFQNLIKLYQKEGSDSVPREEFIDYYRLISAGIKNDLEFINMVKSSWGI